MNKRKICVAYLVTTILTITILSIIYNFNKIDIKEPIEYYTGDGVAAAYLMKTIDETGWFLENPRVGGGTADYYDYMMGDDLSFFIVKVISIFTDNVFLIYNLFYFSTYIIVALTAMYAFTKLKIRPLLAVVFSILYAFMPYHQLRIGHIWLTPYFMVPLVCLICIEELDGDNNAKLLCISDWRNKQFIVNMLISALAAFTGLYYAFFTCCIYAIVLVMVMIKREWHRVCKVVMYIISVVVGVLFNTLPSLIYIIKNGNNSASELSIRGMGEAEVYAAKFIQFILPRPDHRINKLAELAKYYSTNTTLTNENMYAALGIIGGIGFICLFLVLFNVRNEDKQIKNIALLNLGTFLIATMGGIGAIFALLVKTPMRCYNRLSVYIGFFSFAFLAIVCNNTADKLSSKSQKKIIGTIGIISLLIIGIYDQTITFDQYTQIEQKTERQHDEEFVHIIENELPVNSKIYQLPHVCFPSGGTYMHLMPYLNSSNLIWSFGAMQGRGYDEWEHQLKELDLEQMVEQLSINNYSGIWIDGRIYEMQNDESVFQEEVDTLVKLLGVEPKIHPNGKVMFFDMSGYNQQFTSHFSNEELEERKMIGVDYVNGFYGKEFAVDKSTFRWSNGKSTLVLNNFSDIEKNISFEAEILGVKNESNLIITRGDESKRYLINPQGTIIKFECILQPGKNEFILECDAEHFIPEEDPRTLCFMLHDVKVVNMN